MTDLVTALGEDLPPDLVDSAADWDLKVTGDDAVLECGAGAFPLRFPGLLDDWPAAAADSAYHISNFAALLRGHHPSTVVDNFPAFVPFLAHGGQAGMIPPNTAWIVAVRVTEACRELMVQAVRDGDMIASRLLPLVHRARFLLLSAPTRYGADVSYPTETVFNNSHVYAARFDQARLEWALDLLNYEDHPLLRRWSSHRIDTELRRLVFVHDSSGGASARAPLCPGGTAPPTGGDPSNDGHDELATWIAREGFLPRFMLDESWSATRQVVGARRWLALPIGLLTLPVVGLVVGLAGGRHVDGLWILRGMAISAAVALAVIAGFAVWRRETAQLWCMRLPAGATIGMIALVALPEDWAQMDWSTRAWAVPALILAAHGYLVLEAVGHGASRGQALTRAFRVVVLGFAHAVGVVALAFATVVPSLVPKLGGPLASMSGPAMAAAVLFAACVGLAAGVYAQVLWDDRPVTYPLTHLPFRGRERA